MDKLLKWLGSLPTTQARIAVTLALAIGTAVRYWTSATWVPSLEWLGFLACYAGLDVAQFTSKRFSDTGYVQAKSAAPSNGTTTTPAPQP